MTTRLVRLGDYCRQDRTTVRPGERPDLRYIGLETIKSGSGQFQDGELSKTPEVPQANSFHFGPEHVLYGKLRPYLNKVALPEFEGKCSTEIIPLRPDPALDRRYLAYFLRSADTVAHISERTAGARMPRADMDFVLGLQLLLPSLDEQRRIIDLLSRAEGIVRLRREAEKKAAEIIPALFLDMFGDPATNPKGWPLTTLAEIVKDGPSNGLYKHKSAYGSGTPILRIDGFYDGVVRDLASLPRVRIEDNEAKRFALKADDIVINRVNSPDYLGKSAIIPALDERTVFESNMMRLSVDCDQALPRFVVALLQTTAARRHFLSRAKHAINQSSINQQDVKSLPVFLPPVRYQVEFKRRAEMMESIGYQQAVAHSKAEATLKALLARAFSDSERRLVEQLAPAQVGSAQPA